MEKNVPPVISREHLEAQLSIIELLSAMFPMSGELDIPPETLRWTNVLRDWCEEESAFLSADIPAELGIGLRLPVGEDTLSPPRNIELNIAIPMRCADVDAVAPPPLRYFMRQPLWLSKVEAHDFSSSMPQNDIFEAVEWIREEASHSLKIELTSINAKVGGATNERLVRVWFYFPSLSTREKRDDLVNHAPAYKLTGFVLAGKPGVLCLEGTESNIDAYMKWIKTHSWGDIPSHQKKVSERYRETKSSEGLLGVARVFSGMEEITGALGDRSGARANRGDMKALEAWLKERGLGEAFEKVIF